MIISLLALAFVLTAMQCDPKETFTWGEAFKLQIGEEKESPAKAITVQWLQLVEDSRCPTYTNCVWEGQARLSLQVNGETVELILREGHPAEAVQIVNGYEIRAISLRPYPEAGQQTEKEMYRLELQVTQRKEP